MKWKGKSLLFLLFVMSFLSSSLGIIYGQNKVKITAGFGNPEVFNIGLKYRIFNQGNTGFSIGWFPHTDSYLLSKNSYLSFSGDFYYHFAGSTDYSDQNPWYGRIGLNCLLEHDEDIGSSWKYRQPYTYYTYFRIGRDFYFNNKLGINLDAGLGYIINHKVKKGDLLFPVVELHSPMEFPLFGIGFFYRLYGESEILTP